MNTAKSQTTEIEIDLGRLLRFYLKHWVSIAVSGAVLALAALLLTTFTMTPLYRSSVTLYVNNTVTPVEEGLSGANLSAAIHITETYVEFVESRPVMEAAIRDGELPLTVEQLRGIITAKQVDDKEILTITAVHPDPQMAAQVVNTVAKAAPPELAKIVVGSSSRVVEYAEPAAAPFTPNTGRNVVLGALLGLVLAGGFQTLRYIFDMRLENEKDLQVYFTAPVLGVIPNFNQQPKKRRYSEYRRGGRNA